MWYKLWSRIARAIMWLVKPELAPLISEIATRQEQIIQRLKTLEDLAVDEIYQSAQKKVTKKKRVRKKK